MSIYTARCAAASIVGASLVHRDARWCRHPEQPPAARRSLHCSEDAPREQLSISRSQLISKSNDQKVGKVYKLQEDLGEGGFGSVHKSVHRQTGAQRAVKVIPKKYTTPKAFQDEVQALEVLDHPNIVKMIEYFQDARNYYLVQELCTGPDVYDLIRKTAAGCLPERDASIIIRQCIKAVIGCHVAGFIHRDIKLENFMVTSEDKNVKLIDFGLSARLSEAGTAKGLAGTGVYMAPEMLFKKEYSRSVDVWSLGVVLFEMLTGEVLINIDKDAITVGCAYDFQSNSGLREATVVAQNPDGSYEVEIGKGNVVHNVGKTQIVHNTVRELKRLLSQKNFVDLQITEASCRCGFSPDAVDLMRKMLHQDPALRITTSEALSHPFIMKHVYESLDEDISKKDEYKYWDMELEAKLRHYGRLTLLEKIAFLGMAHLSTEGTMGGKLIHVRHMFRRMDPNGDGKIDSAELRQAFINNGRKVPDDLNELFKSCRSNPTSETMSYVEFVAIALASGEISEKQCTSAFMLIDRTSNGQIEKEDLLLMCRDMKYNQFDDIVLEAELKLRDKEQCKGSLSLAEFHTLIRGPEVMEREPLLMPDLPQRATSRRSRK